MRPRTSRDRKALRPPTRVPLGPLDEAARARCDDPTPAELLQAIAEFDRGEYFEQHETLETLWRATGSPVRDLYHGVLQIGVGLHHLRRGNFHGATVLLEEGILRLRPFAPACQHVDVASLVADATRTLERVRALGPERLAEFDWSGAPFVRLVG